MRLLCLAIIVVLSIDSYSQPIVVHKYGDTIVYKGRHLSIGTKHAGIGFGNFIFYNGLKFAFFDKDTLTNGISISLSQTHQPKKTNGIEIGGNISVSQVNGMALGFVNSIYEQLNGVSLSVLYNYNWKTNGIAISGIFQMSDYLNGISFGVLADVHHTVNGFTLTGLYELSDSLKGVSICGITINCGNINGVTIAPINTTDTGHGLQVGLYNEAKNLKGIQIGLININKAKKHLKVLPLINFH